MKMYAMLTEQETAMPETALCEVHIKDEMSYAEALENGLGASDAGEEASLQDCSGNELLECLKCGASMFGPYVETLPS